MNLETHQTCFHQWKKTCVFLKFETPRFVFDVTHRTLPWQHHLFRLAKKEAENAAKAKSWNVSTWWFNLMLAKRKIQLGCRTKKVVMDGNCFRILIKSLINFISSIQISSTQLLRILRICHVFQKPQRSNQKEKQYKLKELCLWSPCFFPNLKLIFSRQLQLTFSKIMLHLSGIIAERSTWGNLFLETNMLQIGVPRDPSTFI